MKETFKIKNLEQIKLLSDPLKLQLIQAFAEDAKTTKQVATELGESVTKLYRHVDALLDAELIEIAEEKQKRGTVERTFRAVARRFEADHALFADQADEEATHAARELLRSAENEILGALAADGDRDEREALFARVRCKASPERVDEFRNILKTWLESAQEDDDSDDERATEFGALIAFYPIK
ncbi:MAG: helix-turn-helix domain-containing protein [Woeseiaceae bacterium]